MGFYLQYLATWPEYFLVEEAPHDTGRLSCYSACCCCEDGVMVCRRGDRSGPNPHHHHPPSLLYYTTPIVCTVMGKAEGKGELWHGHVTAVTVAPEYRRLGKVNDRQGEKRERGTKGTDDLNTTLSLILYTTPHHPTHPLLPKAKTLMNLLEEVSERAYNAYFVDLFVRVSNALAISMYKRFGYTVYRQVLGYYSGEEDAYGACVVWWQ